MARHLRPCGRCGHWHFGETCPKCPAVREARRKLRDDKEFRHEVQWEAGLIEARAEIAKEESKSKWRNLGTINRVTA